MQIGAVGEDGLHFLTHCINTSLTRKYKKLGSGDLPPEIKFDMLPSERSENALLQAEMFLLSSVEYMLKRRNWCYRILKIKNEKENATTNSAFFCCIHVHRGVARSLW